MTRFKRSGLCAFLVIALAIALTACGSDDNKSDSSSSSASTISVPSEFAGKTLTIATDATYPPLESINTDGKTIVGADVDIGNAIGKQLGLQTQFKNAGFDSILPALASGKFDMSLSSFTDNKEREKTVDFVTYASAGTSFYVSADGGPDIKSVSDLCGHKVAVEKGTTQQTDVEAQKKKCDVDLQTYPDQNGANQALASGRADVGMADSPVAVYVVDSSKGKFKISGEPYGKSPYGIALPKGSKLAEPVRAAVAAIIADGSYAKILKKWDISSFAITDPKINGAIN
jgi:polar amino acid transport system substrate-binding protein